MNRKRKIGISLVLIGFGIPIVLFFFQYDYGVIYKTQTTNVFERKLNPTEIESIQAEVQRIEKRIEAIDKESLEPRMTLFKIMQIFDWKTKEKEIWTIKSVKTISIPFRQIVGVGIAFIFFGFGMFIFSFSPKDKPKKTEVEE